MIALVLSLVLSLQSFASCKSPISYLQETEKAPCSGYLITPELELQIRKDLVTLDGIMEIVKKQEDLILLYQDKSEYTSKRIKTLERQAELTAWEKVLYFAIGVVAAGAAVYAAK